MSKETFKNILLSFCHMKETTNLPLALNDYSALLNQMFEEKETKIAVLERALELACETFCSGSHPEMRFEIENFSLIKGVENYFKTKAESDIKNEKE